jgi:hypothetical protein
MPAATTHTATYDAGNARVAINLAGFAAGTTSVQIVRRNLDTGGSALVRGARSIAIVTPASDTVLVFDYEFPAGALVRFDYYQFPDTTAYPVAAAGSYDVAGVWLKHTTRPYLSRMVRLDADFDPFEHQVRMTAAAAVRAAVPVGAGDVRGGRVFRLTAKTDDGDYADIDNLLKVGGTLYYQRPSSDVGLPRASYVVVTAAKERIRGPVQLGGRYWDLTMAEVQRPDADLVAAAITCNDVLATWATCADLLAQVATINDLLAQVADPTEVVV